MHATDRTAQERRLRERGDWLGASCVCRWRDAGFLFAGQVDGDDLVLSGIGGKVEPGESFADAMVREFEEETGCRIDAPRRPSTPVHLTAAAAAEPVPDGAAALIARRPDAHPTGGTLWIAVFLAVLAEVPKPVEKISTFVVVPPVMYGRSLDELAVADLMVVGADTAVPAREVLAPAVRRISAVDTAAAVLSTPGVLSDWWAATEGNCP